MVNVDFFDPLVSSRGLGSLLISSVGRAAATPIYVKGNIVTYIGLTKLNHSFYYLQSWHQTATEYAKCVPS